MIGVHIVKQGLRALLVGLVAFTGGLACAITLVENGQPKATIVISTAPGTPTEGSATAAEWVRANGTAADRCKRAAEELQTYIQKMSGAKLPMVTDAENPKGALILIGKSKLTDAMGVKVPSGLTHLRKEEGFTIVCKGDRLVLAGNTDGPYRGTEYAVYDFLERLGVRWFMPSDFGEIVPKQSTITFTDVTITEKPDFLDRGWETDEKWGIRNKMGLGSGFVAPDTSVWYVLPPFEEQPELYALGPDGKRNKDLGICYSNPDTAEAAAENIIAQLKKDPYLNYVGIAPPDGIPACSCPECKTANQGFPHGTGGGYLSASEEWIIFANKVAELVYKVFPDRYVWTNGYSNRHFAPQNFTRFTPNLGVMFAGIEDCTMHAFDDPQCWQKQAQALNLQRWSALSKGKLSIYDYNLQMMVSSLTPMPMVHKYREEFPLWKKWGVLGYVLCTKSCWAEEGILTKYLRARLAWDANADVEAIMRDFYTKWYGNTARSMRAYWDALDNAIGDAPFHGHENTFMPDVYTPRLMTQLDRWIAEAEQAAATDRDRKHVKLDRLIHDHLKAYVAMEAADDECNYAECIAQANRMLALRKQANDYVGVPYMLQGEYAYTTEERIKEWQGWLDKINGKNGKLIAILPAEARFKTDPRKEGYDFQWYRADIKDASWRKLLTTRGWEAGGFQDKQGYNYTGMAWYRMNVDVPAIEKGTKIMLFVPGEVEEAWCWVNGEYVGHHPYHNVWWRTPFTHEFNVMNAIKPGQRNQITFRVLCNEGYFGVSGIFRRMLLYAPVE